MITTIMPKIVHYKGDKYKILSYTPNGNMVNALWYYVGAPKQIHKPKKKWHTLVNLGIRLQLARKFPKRRKK